jgi:hypothetical protein
MHRLVEGFPGLRFADAHDVAGPGRGSSEQAGLVADRARGLGSSAVNAKVIGHEFIFNTEVPVLVSPGLRVRCAIMEYPSCGWRQSLVRRIIR